LEFPLSSVSRFKYHLYVTLQYFVSRNKAKKVKKLNIVKLKGQEVFFFFNPDDGKQPKTFGFDLFIFPFLTF